MEFNSAKEIRSLRGRPQFIEGLKQFALLSRHVNVKAFHTVPVRTLGKHPIILSYIVPASVMQTQSHENFFARKDIKTGALNGPNIHQVAEDPLAIFQQQ